MLRMEAGRGVTAVGCTGIDPVVEVILSTEEESFVVVTACVGVCILGIHNGGGKLFVVLGVHVLLAAIEVSIAIVIVLMAKHHVDTVLAELLVVVEELLGIEGE